MHELQKKRKLKKIIYSRGSAVLLIIISVILFRGSWEVHQKEAQSRNDLENVRRELEVTEAKESFLTASLGSLDTTRGQEEEIRDRFNVTKPGEKVVFVVDSTENSEAENQTEGGLWTKVKVFFNNIFSN
jgi:cell division protein FtsB